MGTEEVPGTPSKPVKENHEEWVEEVVLVEKLYKKSL